MKRSKVKIKGGILPLVFRIRINTEKMAEVKIPIQLSNADVIELEVLMGQLWHRAQVVGGIVEIMAAEQRRRSGSWGEEETD